MEERGTEERARGGDERGGSVGEREKIEGWVREQRMRGEAQCLEGYSKAPCNALNQDLHYYVSRMPGS